MTTITDISTVRRVHVHADGSSTVLTWNNRKQADERTDHPPERLAWVTDRYCTADRPHVHLLDQIEQSLPPLPGWTLGRFHYSGFAVLAIRRSGELINVLVTAKMDAITVGHQRTRKQWGFRSTDAEGVNECITRLTQEARSC